MVIDQYNHWIARSRVYKRLQNLIALVSGNCDILILDLREQQSVKHVADGDHRVRPPYRSSSVRVFLAARVHRQVFSALQQGVFVMPQSVTNKKLSVSFA